MSGEATRALTKLEEEASSLRSKLLNDQGTNRTGWFDDLERADLRVTIFAIGGLSSRGSGASMHEAARDAARSMLELKLTERLMWIGVAVAVVGVVVAIALAVVAA